MEGTYVNVVDNNPFFFRVRPDDKFCAEAAVKFVMGTLGKTKIGVIYGDDEFGMAGRNNIVKAIKATQGTIAGTMAYNSKDEGLVAQ
ncbi:MAG: Extracellular ligand-binding receptor [Firmicutes bacterium]|nr:Extracellular ligand-binding receptor [Bacillota bacterium]